MNREYLQPVAVIAAGIALSVAISIFAVDLQSVCQPVALEKGHDACMTAAGEVKITPALLSTFIGGFWIVLIKFDARQKVGKESHN